MDGYWIFVGGMVATLLPVVNPLTTASVFIGLTGQMTNAQRAHQANLVGVSVFITLVVCFYAGQGVMHMLGLSLHGVRLAGGMILVRVGYSLLFPPDRSQAIGTGPLQGIVFVPLTLPMSVGPAAMAVILSQATRFHDGGAHGLLDHAAVLTAHLGVAIVVWGALRVARALLLGVGEGGVQGLSRIMGFLLVCLGVQIALDGVQGGWPVWFAGSALVGGPVAPKSA
jgi:multiple antibiotic resistance protein